MDTEELTPEERKNIEGLNYLTWDMFDSPGEPGSGYNFMEREPVLILDQIVHKTRRFLNVELGYVSKTYADKNSFPTKDSHRVGKAIRLRIVGPRKRMAIIKELILFGVERIAVDRETVYFDTDDLKPPQFALWTWISLFPLLLLVIAPLYGGAFCFINVKVLLKAWLVFYNCICL